jgi:hypothetical protein
MPPELLWPVASDTGLVGLIVVVQAVVGRRLPASGAQAAAVGAVLVGGGSLLGRRCCWAWWGEWCAR